MKKSLFVFLPLLALTACGQSSSLSSSLLSSESSKETYLPQYAMPEDADISGTANDLAYDVSNVQRVEGHPLAGKKIYWLGSSVTRGEAAGAQSMADFLAAKTGAICKKDAVSGTTIYDDGGTSDATSKNSYTRRLVNSTIFDPNEEIDAFICQISTNDSTNSRLNMRGEISADDVLDMEEFNRKTTLGGIEFIISYVSETWDCPIYFYSGSYFSDGNNKAQRQNSNPKGSEYGKLVSQTQEILNKWNKQFYIHADLIDLYNDKDFNDAASDAYYSWSTSDPIHPKKAGYLQWWMPYFESFLLNDMTNWK